MILALLLAIQTAARPAPAVLQTVEGARQPQVAIAAFARFPVVFVAFGTKTGIYVARSANSARTFGVPERIAEVGALSLGMRRGPRIAAVPKGLVVTAIAGEKGGGQDGDLVCLRSEDDGKSWKKAGRINPVAGSAREGLHAMEAGPGWKVFVAWIDLEGDAPRVLGSLTEDAGATWSKPIVLEGDSNAICPCCSPSVGYGPDDSVAVMWRNRDGENRDMVVARSSDGGKSFSKAAKLGSGSWKIDACPMDGGALDGGLGFAAATWRRESRIYRGDVGGPEVLVGEGEQPWIAASKLGTYVVWVQGRLGSLQLLPPGSKTPVELDPAANDPVVASAGPDGLTIAAWESGDPEKPKLMVTRVDDLAAPK